jgi:hypothetical protein
MATTISNGLPISASTSADPLFTPRAYRRHISPEAGRALRILGHAIEYLANEFLHDVIPPSADNERLQAVQLLMSLNREVYSECPEEPEAPTFRERCRHLLGSRRA